MTPWNDIADFKPVLPKSSLISWEATNCQSKIFQIRPGGPQYALFRFHRLKQLCAEGCDTSSHMLCQACWKNRSFTLGSECHFPGLSGELVISALNISGRCSVSYFSTLQCSICIKLEWKGKSKSRSINSITGSCGSTETGHCYFGRLGVWCCLFFVPFMLLFLLS